ncbi:MAG: hypothetical protein PHR56_09480, partial [Dehalococcoidales bacterium]|nr:hypothetical protein [Dehalococcoidales bacterium]
MANKRFNIYFYLTLACFLGLIAVFVFGGYIGVYDSFKITSGEITQTIQPDVWRTDNPYWSTGIAWGDKTVIRYEIDNRRFSDYSADISVSIWRSQEKISDILAQPVSLGSFKKTTIEFTVDTSQFNANISREQSYQFTMVVKRGDTERRIVLHISPGPYGSRPIAPP